MTNLTEQQKRQQEAAAFGLPQADIDPSKFTHEQIEAFREVVFARDAANAAMTREFDLNKPPTPPYRYQEFPRMLYRKDKTVIVKNAAEQAKLLTQGWNLQPVWDVAVPGAGIDAAAAAEAAAIDAQLNPKREFADEDIERLRELVAAHDAKHRPKRKQPDHFRKWNEKQKAMKAQASTNVE